MTQMSHEMHFFPHKIDFSSLIWHISCEASLNNLRDMGLHPMKVYKEGVGNRDKVKRPKALVDMTSTVPSFPYLLL